MVRGDPIGAGYAEVEVLGGCGWAKCEGSWLGPKNQKLNREGSVLASKVRASSFLVRGDPIGAGYAGVEVLRGCGWAKCEGSRLGPKTKN